MPVVIDQVTLTGDPGSGGIAPPEEPGKAAPMSEDDFRHFYGAVIRSILREEIERELRHGAD